MYSREQLSRGVRRGLETPSFYGRELNRLYYRRLYRREFNTDGIDIFTQEWDNLLLLDACRYDDFAALHDLPGELESRVSRGSHTVEFLRGNVAGRDLLDTVYVTASPQFHVKDIDAKFHAVDNVWDSDGWDDSVGTVRPETMAERTIAAAERYPDKRLLVHFIQPHYPFVADPSLFAGSLLDSDTPDIWALLLRGDGDVAPATVRAAYRRNLKAVLPAVRRLLGTLEGMTVVSADHGNMFGERATPVPIREWGHPPGVYTEELVRVPWLTHRNGRRHIEADPPVEGATTDDVESDVESRLRHLGYV
jgi:hypothetical protein